MESNLGNLCCARSVVSVPLAPGEQGQLELGGPAGQLELEGQLGDSCFSLIETEEVAYSATASRLG